VSRFALRYNRVHAVAAELRKRATAARDTAAALDDADSPFAASLRGKARGYDEAVQLIERLEHNRPLRGKSRWSR
jgi:hypothetical protein